MADGHGSFCWYELMTSDPAAAVAFYRKVVGWTEQAVSNADGDPYTLLRVGERGVAGVMDLPPPVRESGGRPNWLGYILVDDVDQSVARLTAAGGAVHRPASDIPGIGRFAVVADPQGAAFILFRNAPVDNPPPAVAATEPGGFGWRELMAADSAAAFDFYAGQFGWTKTEAHDMGAMGVYQLFASDGETIGGMMTKPAQIPAPFWTYYITVDGVAAAVERLKAGGGAVVNGPHEVPGGAWIVQAADPQGAIFALTSANA